MKYYLIYYGSFQIMIKDRIDDVELNDRKLFDSPGDAHSLCSKMITKRSDKIKEERK